MTDVQYWVTIQTEKNIVKKKKVQQCILNMWWTIKCKHAIWICNTNCDQCAILVTVQIQKSLNKIMKKRKSSYMADIQ